MKHEVYDLPGVNFGYQVLYFSSKSGMYRPVAAFVTRGDAVDFAKDDSMLGGRSKVIEFGREYWTVVSVWHDGDQVEQALFWS